MTEEYRQKLLNWFCSMGLLMLVSTLALGITWRIVTINIGISYGGSAPLDRYAGPAGVGFMAFFLFFPPIAFWHFCDFLESDQNPHRWRGFFANYRSFAMLLLLVSPVAILGASEGVELTGDRGVFCYKPGNFGDFLYHPCLSPGISEQLLVILIAPLVAFACISKATTAIRSHVKRDHD